MLTLGMTMKIIVLSSGTARQGHPLVPHMSRLHPSAVPSSWSIYRTGWRSRRLPLTVQASKRQAKTAKGSKAAGSGGGGKKKAHDFEQLMIDWDDVFDALCKDPSKAARLEAAAARGYEQQGRGFLFVRVCVSTRSKKKAAAAEGTAAAAQAAAAKGFGARPSAPEPAGAPLPNNPRLVEHSWAATYIPGGCLAALGGIFSEGSTPLPDPSLLVSTGGVGEAGSSQAPSSTAASGGSASTVEPSLLEELQRALRGMDAGRLAMLVGCSWALPEVYQPAAGGASQGQQQQLQDRVPLDGVPPGDEEQEWASSGRGGGLGSMSLHEGAGAGFGPQWDSNDLLSDDGGLSDSSSGVGGGGSAGGGAAGGLSDPATADGGVVGAERAYEPEACEFVVLLLARVDQQPAIGADIVRAVGDAEAGSTQLIMPGLQGLAFA